MGHGNSDRLYVTREEMSGVHGAHTAGGGRRLKGSDAGFERLPFYCCALSLQAWSIPVCAPDGTLFELTNIIPFLKKHGVNPVTGEKLEARDLIRLNFAQNVKGAYHDPVSFKEFNDHTHIVAIKSSGNVFSYETVQQLNIKAKQMQDLVDDTPFTKKDLITVQDPQNVDNRNVNNMHHVKASLKWARDDGLRDVNVHASTSTAESPSSLREIAAGAQEHLAGPSSARQTSMPVAQEKTLPQHVARTTTGMMAASFTSSGLDVKTTNERQVVNEEEYMFGQVATGHGVGKGKTGRRVKGYVRIDTNFGPLDIELHIDKAPKTCYNFLELCKAQRYDDTIFHRLIPGFMVQGGDPSGTGRGGESVWGQPFRDEFEAAAAYRHTHRGTLSMANKGPNTSGSQWFIAFRRLPNLDGKHTVFGQLVEESGNRDGARATSPSMTTLDAIEGVPTEPGTDRPLRSIRIVKTYVLDNPFDDYKASLERRIARESGGEEYQQAREAKRRKREEDRTTWLGTNLDKEKAVPVPASNNACVSGSASASRTNGIGKYLQGASRGMPNASSLVGALTMKKTKTASTQGTGGFGDFSSW